MIQSYSQQMMARSAILWEISEDDVEFDQGVFKSKSDPSKAITFKALAAKLGSTGGPVMGRATVKPTGVGGAFSIVLVDVEVDVDTGKVQILRASIFQDVGKAIYPPYVEGQMQGAVSQGIGWALMENYILM